MSDAELRRVRADLDTMQEAVGLELPFEWADVWLTLGLVPCGVVAAAWAGFGPSDYLVLSALPFVALALTFGVWRLRGQLRSGRPAVRRETSFGAVAGAALALGLLGLVAWEKTLGLPYRVVRGAGFILAGVLSIPLALSSPGRRPFLGMLALAPVGLFLPLCSTRPQDVVLAALGGSGVGLVCAAIMAWQLRRQEQP